MSNTSRETDSPRASDNTLLEHLEELRGRIIRIFLTVLIIAATTLVLGIRRIDIEGVWIYVPFPDPYNSVSAFVLTRISEDVLPDSVELIQTAPGQALMGVIYVGIFLGLVLGMPIILHQTISFVAPGLYENERKSIFRVLIPAVTLFFIGGIFSYISVVPFAIRFLYTFGIELGFVTFITSVDLISFVLLFFLAFGITFQTPVIMWLFTIVGIVDATYWRKNIRYAFVVMVFLGAALTPDGSGVTMWFVTLPMLGLYVAGYLIIRASSPASQRITS